jgi:hypothetical protein
VWEVLVQDRPYYYLGDLLEDLADRALHDWRDRYARGTRIDDLLAERVKRVEWSCTVHPGGHADLLVKVVTRNPVDCEQYFDKAVRVANAWRLVPPTTAP